MTADAVGGVWRYAVDLGSALRRKGASITLAVMGPPPDARQHQEAVRAGLHVVDRPYRLEWMDDPWTDLGRAAEWLLDLERIVEPDVVHLNGYAHASLPWQAPVIVVAHSCVRTWWRAVRAEAAPVNLDRYTAAVAAGLGSARCVVAPTAAMLAALQAEYGPLASTRVIPNGRAAMPGGVPVRLERKERFVIAAGRAWDEAKNIGAICAVARRLPWPVYVAGSTTPPDGNARDLPGVHLLGHLAPVELERWFRRAAIYALPARYEPFGLSVLEAAEAGCALVLGDIESLRENWDGAAVFVPPADEDALVSAISSLANDPAARAGLARRSLARAAGVSIEQTADEYRSVYERLIA